MLQLESIRFDTATLATQHESIQFGPATLATQLQCIRFRVHTLTWKASDLVPLFWHRNLKASALLSLFLHTTSKHPIWCRYFCNTISRHPIWYRYFFTTLQSIRFGTATFATHLHSIRFGTTTVAPQLQREGIFFVCFFGLFVFSLGPFFLLLAAFWSQNLWFACFLLHFGARISDLLLAFGFWLWLLAFGSWAFSFWLGFSIVACIWHLIKYIAFKLHANGILHEILKTHKRDPKKDQWTSKKPYIKP